MRDGQLTLDVNGVKPEPFRGFEQEAYDRGYKCVAGLDEVGRGPLAGPVVAAAVVLPPGFAHAEIKDSKLLTAKQREKMAAVVRQNAECWAVGVVAAKDIDRLNIHQASLLAMVKALASLASKADCLLIDGKQSIPLALFRIGKFLSGRSTYQRTIVRGDQLCLSISAASIIAKVARDQLMMRLDTQYPEYGFAAHKGYSCAAHCEALRRFGPSPVHRRSFKPVRDVLPPPQSIGPLFE
jgi:ribonuclease HII